MKWTTEKPKDTGWYWTRFAIPLIGYVRKDFSTGELLVFYPGSTDKIPLSNILFENIEWSGPITEPEEIDEN